MSTILQSAVEAESEWERRDSYVNSIAMLTVITVKVRKSEV